MHDRLDYVIRGATLYDGSGDPPRRADVGLRGDRIARVGEIPESAGASLTATGLALAPGFIDVHSHDDLAVLLYPDMAFKLMQGVTTDVVGNCGLGAAPHPVAKAVFHMLHPEAEMPVWEGYRGYLDCLDRDPASLNVGVLVGHGTARAAVMGGDARAPDAAELRAMREIVREGLEAGALGLSTGLIYEPGMHARSDEIVALAGELAQAGGVYATHMRDEGEGLLDSIQETLEVGKRAGVPVQVSHHKAAGRSAWGKVRESLALLEQARARGLDASADQYPYVSASTVLAAIAPRIPEDEASLENALLGPADVIVSACARRREWEGRTLGELSQELALAPAATARRILEEEPGTWVIMNMMSEEDVQQVLRHPTTMIGSDGIPTLEGKPHPRLYGTFARVLGRYARELGTLSLTEAIHKMTGFPASKFGLAGRGFVREGFAADLVLFDPESVAETSSVSDPHRHPEGIRNVFVNGVPVVRDGVHTGARPGRALRRGESASRA